MTNHAQHQCHSGRTSFYNTVTNISAYLRDMAHLSTLGKYHLKLSSFWISVKLSNLLTIHSNTRLLLVSTNQTLGLFQFMTSHKVIQ